MLKGESLGMCFLSALRAKISFKVCVAIFTNSVHGRVCIKDIFLQRKKKPLLKRNGFDSVIDFSYCAKRTVAETPLLLTARTL